MGGVLTLALKDLRLLLRDRFALFWILAFPFVFALFFGALFSDGGDGGGGSPLPISVVDEDGTAASRELLARLADHESLSVDRDEQGVPVAVDLEAARDAVRKGRRVAYLRLPAGYGDQPFALFAPTDDGSPALELGVDPSRAAEKGLLQGLLTQVLFEGLADRFGDRELMRAELAKGLDELRTSDDDGLGPAQRLVLTTFLQAVDRFFAEADLDTLGGDSDGDGQGDGLAFGGDGLFEVVPLDRERQAGPRTAFDITLPSGILWGLMSISMSFAVLLVRERSEGTWLRLAVSPMTRAQLLAGKGLACFLTCLAVMALLLLFGILALGVQVDSLPLLIVALCSTAACFTGLMMVASVMGRTEQAVAGTSWGLMMPLAMVGGGMIPLIAMPPWLRTASDFSPFKWGILALEGALWRGFEVGDMLLPVAILLGTGGLAFAVGVTVLRRRDEGA